MVSLRYHISDVVVWRVFLLFAFLILDHIAMFEALILSSNPQLQEEAALALKCLEKSGDSAFEDIFMTKIDFPAKYDYCLRYGFLILKLLITSSFISLMELYLNCHLLLERSLNLLTVIGF